METLVDELLSILKAKLIEGFFGLLSSCWNFFIDYLPFFILFAICYVGFIRPFRRRF